MEDNNLIFQLSILIGMNKIASLEDGNVSVKNELGNQEIYRMEDLIDTELVFEDKEEVYVFLSRSSFQDNTDWTINNIEDMTFEIDSGRIYGDNVDMTYDAGINEVRKISLTVLWLSLLAGSSMQIYGIKDDNSEVLLLEVRNNTSIESSIFNNRGTKIVEFLSYRHVEFLEVEDGVKKVKIKTNSSSLMFESLQLTLRRG